MARATPVAATSDATGASKALGVTALVVAIDGALLAAAAIAAAHLRRARVSGSVSLTALRADAPSAIPNRRPAVLKLAAPLVVICLAFAACGGDDDDSSGSTAATSGGGGASLAVAADPSGGLAYTETELTAEAGAVEIDFTNDSQTPHDVVLERDGDEVARTEVVTDDSSSASAELTAGEYAFYCSVAGHRQAGMEGTLTVK